MCTTWGHSVSRCGETGPECDSMKLIDRPMPFCLHRGNTLWISGEIYQNFICKQLPILAPYWLHVGLHSSCDEGFWLMYSKCIQYKNLEQLLRYFWRWDKPYFCMYLKIWSIYMHVGIHVCMYVCNICPSVCLSVLPSTHPPSNNLSSTIQTSIHLFIRVPQSRSVQHLFENHDYKIMWSMAITQPS